MAMEGMNVAKVRDVGLSMIRQADALETCAHSIDRVVESAGRFWQGPDVSQFRARWEGNLRRVAQAAGADLRELGQTVARNADAQERTSDTLEGGAGGVHAPGSAQGLQGGVGDTANEKAGPVVPMNRTPGDSDADLGAGNVQQGQIGDCWLLAAIGGVGEVDPDFLRRHIVHNPDGSYTVTMYDKHDPLIGATTFTPVQVTVPASHFQNGVKDANGDPSLVSVYELAAAQHRGGSASDIKGAPVHEGLELVTGREATTHNDPPLSDIQQGLAEGRIYQAGTNADLPWWPWDGSPNAQLVDNHAYMVDKVEMRDGELKIHVLNPWGTSSTPNGVAQDIWLSEKEFHENFGDVASVAGK